MTPEFIHFPKIARLSRLAIVTEKIDGTNAQCLKSHQHMSTDSETYVIYQATKAPDLG
jgi:hypothetical protein